MRLLIPFRMLFVTISHATRYRTLQVDANGEKIWFDNQRYGYEDDSIAGSSDCQPGAER